MAHHNQRLTCSQANEIDLVEYLSTLGIEPDKIRNNDYWYFSPFRKEETPSFKINRTRNIWFDHGEGTGGSLLDFGLRYHNCQIPELLSKLSESFPFHPPISRASKKLILSPENPIKILNVGPINSFDLLLYLKDRRIDFGIATRYCKQVEFEVNNTPMKTLGFANDQAGFELRNPRFKGSSSPKTSTTILSGAEELNVFEGFFDFMSYQMMNQNADPGRSDFLILNSTAFFERNHDFMESYPTVKLFLDHDPTGEKYTRQALEWGSKYEDKSSLYKGYKDLNEWIQSIGKAQVNSFRPKLH
jgi:Toprim-like/CHC2 zinc finger